MKEKPSFSALNQHNQIKKQTDFGPTTYSFITWILFSFKQGRVAKNILKKLSRFLKNKFLGHFYNKIKLKINWKFF